MKLLDGKLISRQIEEEIKNKIISNNYNIKMAVILDISDSTSLMYARIKSKVCDRLGIELREIYIDKNTSTEDLLGIIDVLNADNSINGIIIQTPVSDKIDLQVTCNRIKEDKDIDGLRDDSKFVPATASGILKLLDLYNINVNDKEIVIINRSNIIGKPLEKILKEKANVTVCHTQTEDLKAETLKADIIITATGKAKLITEDMVKEGVVIIDAGINYDSGLVCGDVDFENVKEKVEYITPVPGGVGPMTVISLINNLVKAYEMQNQK